MTKVSDYQRTYNKINLSMSIERTYTSYFRNSIILFSLGLTVLGLTKQGEKEKMILGLSLILGGITLGYVAVKEYYEKINLIKEEKYDIYPKNVSNTIYIVGTILIIFTVLFIIRLINMNNQHNIFKFY
jgi:uncharacterized membrane protein YidH (DUF202 family)